MPVASYTVKANRQIFNLGTSDYYSLENHASEYNRTSWELFERFEDSYVSLVKAIRQLAYPKHPDIDTTPSSSSYATSPEIAPAAIPIFLMRPFRGHFEHATQSAVKRLREDGDSSVFWLDTSGWLNLEDTTSEDKDFQLDEADSPSRWRLTERGNQRVAIFLHMHVCRYLAADREQCSFLPPEMYQGKVFRPESARFDWYLEEVKERKLKEAFWDA